MDKPISVGDLVQVVRGRWCCGHETWREGNIFTVTAIKTAFHQEYCLFCGRADIEPGALGHPDTPLAIDVSSLKRIPDFPELADERHDEEISA